MRALEVRQRPWIPSKDAGLEVLVCESVRVEFVAAPIHYHTPR